MKTGRKKKWLPLKDWIAKKEDQKNRVYTRSFHQEISRHCPLQHVPDVVRVLHAKNEFFNAACLWRRIDGIWTCREADPGLDWIIGMTPNQAKLELARKGCSWTWLPLPLSPLRQSGLVAAPDEIDRSAGNLTDSTLANQHSDDPGQEFNGCASSDGSVKMPANHSQDRQWPGNSSHPRSSEGFTS